MTTLRIYLDAAPDTTRDMDWALFDASERVVRSGRTRSAQWPAAEALEGVVAATHGRIVTLALPPLPAARAAAAVRYALEDQLAGAPEDSHLALAPQAPDGSLRVAIVADSWMRSLMSSSQSMNLRWRRLVLESDLAQPPEGGWCWCAPTLQSAGFVRTAEGATLAVGPALGETPPDELVSAIAGRRELAPRQVRVDVAGVMAPLLAQSQKITGVEFVAGRPWRWSAAAPAAWKNAIDLHADAPGGVAPVPRATVIGVLRPALWVAACALGIHVLASVGQWGWLYWQSLQLQREIAALAQTAAPEEVAAGVAPIGALARRDALLRHRAGRAADDDALPLLSRAAPALATLPAGALRSLHYVDAHVVIELQQQDAAQAARVQRELQRNGLVVIAAPTANGARLRIGLD
jgi:type II secretion system protein L